VPRRGLRDHAVLATVATHRLDAHLEAPVLSVCAARGRAAADDVGDVCCSGCSRSRPRSRRASASASSEPQQPAQVAPVGLLELRDGVLGGTGDGSVAGGPRSAASSAGDELVGVGKRQAGSLRQRAQHDVLERRRHGGVELRRRHGSSETCLSAIVTGDSPSNGTRPVSSS
jgi:hypothetical protein